MLEVEIRGDGGDVGVWVCDPAGILLVQRIKPERETS